MTLEYLLPTTNAAPQADGADVIAGLTSRPKALPPKYFYDDRGSQLFEHITELPEYYLTRTETEILNRYASAIVRMTGPCELVELGSGSSNQNPLSAQRHGPKLATISTTFRSMSVVAC